MEIYFSERSPRNLDLLDLHKWHLLSQRKFHCEMELKEIENKLQELRDKGNSSFVPPSKKIDWRNVSTCYSPEITWADIESSSLKEELDNNKKTDWAFYCSEV